MVHCVTPDGDLIGKIPVPEKVANVYLGGPGRERLYICGHTSFYAIHVKARGAQTRRAPVFERFPAAARALRRAQRNIVLTSQRCSLLFFSISATPARPSQMKPVTALAIPREMKTRSTH